MTSSFLGAHINDCHKKGDQHRMGLLCRSATDTLGTFISNKSDGTHLTHLSMMKGFENMASLMIILKIYVLRERKDIDRGQTNAGCQQRGTESKNAAGD